MSPILTANKSTISVLGVFDASFTIGCQMTVLMGAGPIDADLGVDDGSVDESLLALSADAVSLRIAEQYQASPARKDLLERFDADDPHIDTPDGS